MTRNSDIERLRARVDRLCRAVSPPRLDVNVWMQGADGEEPELIYTTVPDRSSDDQALAIIIKSKEEAAHS